MPERDVGFRCISCGFDGIHQPSYTEDGIPSFEICPCCGFQPGFDDLSEGVSAEQYRKQWIEGGKQWWSTLVPPPESWDPDVQLRIFRSSSDEDAAE